MKETEKNIYDETKKIESTKFISKEENSSNTSPDTEDYSSLKYSSVNSNDELSPIKKETVIKRLRNKGEEEENSHFVNSSKKIFGIKEKKIKKHLKYLRQLEKEEMKQTKKFTFK